MINPNPLDATMNEQLWPAVAKLLRLRWLIWIGSLRRTGRKNKIRMAVLFSIAIIGLVFLFFLSYALLRFLSSPQLAELTGDPLPILNNMPVVIVTATFLGILFTSFGVLLQALYLAGDMDFLISAPVPLRAVFLSKLIQAILPNFSLILVFALPVLYGLGLSQGYRWIYYPLVLIILSALAFVAAGLSSLLVMGIVRIFPARRVAEVIGLLVAMISFLCSQSGQLINRTEIDQQQVTQTIGLVNRLDTPWSPFAWAGRGLLYVGGGNWLWGLGLSLLTVGLTGVIFYISLSAAEKLYITGWANIQVSWRKRKGVDDPGKLSEKHIFWVDLFAGRLPQAVRGMIVKDFMVLRRDLRNLSQLITPLLFGIFYTVMLIRSGDQPPAGRGEAPEWFMDIFSTLFTFGHVAIALFVGWSLQSRLGLIAFSQEGTNYWLVKTAPLGTDKILSAKFLVAYLPSLAMGWGFIIIISIFGKIDLFSIIYSMVVVAMLVAGTVGLSLAMGIIGVNFEWDDPRKMVRGTTGCLSFLVGGLYLFIGLGLFLGPQVVLSLVQASKVVTSMAGLVLGSVYSLAMTILPLRLVRDRVPQLGEGL